MSEKTYSGKVIVTYGRSLMALMIARSLGERDIEVIGCDSVALTVLSFSKFTTKTELYAPPERDEEHFIESLLKIVKKHKPDDDRPYVLMPVFNETRLIAKYKDRFDGLITVAGPDFDAIDSVDPKDHFAKTVKDLHVTTPQTWLPKTEADVKALLDDKALTFPVFIKPPNDVGGRGISKIKNEDALLKAFKALQKDYPGAQLLIQSAAAGKDYCFCGLFDHGQRKAGMVYRNLRKFPHESGAGVVRETVDDSPFNGIVDTLMQPLNWHGVAEIDFMWDGTPDTPPHMIEVNTRFWAGLDHSIKSNIDFPYLLYTLVTTGKLERAPEPKIGQKTQLPGLSSLSRMHDLFASGIRLNKLEEQWPDIKQHIKSKNFDKIGPLFKEALKESFSLDQAQAALKEILSESRQADKVAYTQDDPFVGLGILFILSSLVQHGKLPPEITS